jgi:hypothetical protein
MSFFLGDYVDSSGHRTGGFMSGLFSGASDIFSLANNFMNLRDTMSRRNTADEVKQAMLGQNSTGGLYDTPSATVDSGTSDATGGRFDGDSFDDDPLLSQLPKPGRIAKALKGFASSSSEGRGVYGRGQPGTPDSPREGKNYGAPSAQGPMVNEGALGGITGTVGDIASGAYNAGKSVGSGGLDWLGSLGEALHNFARNHDAKAQTQPPAYLPPQKPPAVGPAGAGGGAGPGTLDTLQQHGALGSMGAGVPYAGGPSLANNMNPLGQRIMAALTTPTAGSVT